jgi:hypothetical protein
MPRVATERLGGKAATAPITLNRLAVSHDERERVWSVARLT